MPNPNYITTLKDDDKTNDLTPRTTIPAIYDSDLQYLNNNLKASDLNALQGGEVGKLESNFAQIEVSPSLHAYSVGSMLVYNGILYSVTSAISVGDLLVVGTNLQSKSVADSLSDISDYSTSEKRIGTWIDGSPLYRIVIEQAWGTGDNCIVTLPSGITKMINAYGYGYWQTIDQYRPICSQAGDTNYIGGYWVSTNPTEYVFSGGNNWKARNATLYAIFEYTK